MSTVDPWVEDGERSAAANYWRQIVVVDADCTCNLCWAQCFQGLRLLTEVRAEHPGATEAHVRRLALDRALEIRHFPRLRDPVAELRERLNHRPWGIEP